MKMYQIWKLNLPDLGFVCVWVVFVPHSDYKFCICLSRIIINNTTPRCKIKLKCSYLPLYFPFLFLFISVSLSLC